MTNRSAIQYGSYLISAGEFLSKFISTHYGCKSILHIEALDNDKLNESSIKTVIVPYIHIHFRERLLTLWEPSNGFDFTRLATYEYDIQYRMINDYLFDSGHKHGNLYKDLRNERINNEDTPIELVFTDVGRLLTYDELEYERLIISLNTHPLSSEDWIGGNWKNYVDQYRTQLEIISKK
jgi:hypothetical protein|tara:strand:- start:832 stop:1371 length:540 start_codon:yes stop_codon:yes gene_type:complete